MRRSFTSGMLVCVFATAVAWLPPTVEAQTSGPINFIALEPDNVQQQADAELQKFLISKTGLNFKRRGLEDYEKQIHEIAHRHDGMPYVSRMTPYAYVVAELTGADFEILATYLSRRGTFTYHSYFVVRPEYAGFKFSDDPTLEEVASFLSKPAQPTVQGTPALPRTFTYHDEFSTSSYFVPSIFFRRHHIFNVPEAQRSPTVFPITVKQFGNSSSQLIKEVAEGRADIAAVWDAPKDEASADLKKKVRFIQLPDVLPNDLLVVSKWLDPGLKKKIQDKIDAMRCDTPQFSGDYVCWQPIDKAREAQAALEELKRKAVAPPTSVTVQVTAPDSVEPRLRADYEKYVQAAKEAIRFAGTEFVVDEAHSATTADVLWTVKIVHDGAVEITSTVNGEDDIAPVVLPISFTDIDDLEKHIESFLITRVPRFRYVWPYKKEIPTVLRDVSFTPAAAATIQKITWLDLDSHLFNVGDSFKAQVNGDALKFELNTTEKLLFDPMSNTSYRVILVPPVIERPFFRYLTVALVAFLALAAVAAIFDSIRTLRRAAATGASLPAAQAPATGFMPAPVPDSAIQLPIRNPTPSRRGTSSRRPRQPPK